MADKSEKDKEREVQEILSDLDHILRDDKPASPSLPPKPAVGPVVPPEVPSPPAAPPAAVAKPAPPASPALNIELASRAGMLDNPAAAKPQAPKPQVQAQPKAPASLASAAKPPLEIKADINVPPDPVPAPAPAAAPVDIPANIPKEQIRRVAVLFAPNLRAQKDIFISFLDQSALAISKKPLYLRKVVIEEVKPAGDAKALLEKMFMAHAVTALCIVEGLGEAKIRELNETITAGGILFRIVSPGDIQKRSMAVDLIVDMLLLSPEA